MKALLPFDGPDLVEFGAVAQPRPLASEALVRVEAFSVNRGETFLLEKPQAGWRPGKDVAGLVVQAAADGSGPPAGRRVVGHPPAAGWAEYASTARNGGAYHNRNAGIFTVRDGKIVSVREYTDTQHAARVLFPAGQPR